jgi:HSP90 family molecular chaperone
LGTIAKSGSGEFKQLLDNEGDTAEAAENIIGQFGVGFYSSFVVSDNVEVYSRSNKGEPGVMWASDGTGEYQISEVQNLDFDRGTKIVLKLRKDSLQFSKEVEVAKVIKKYSLFNKYPIRLNNQLVNNLEAIWYKEKREVTQDEYEMFYEHLVNSKIPYKYKLHYSTDVPLAIKAIFYIGSSHAEKMQMQQEENKLHLYSRKVLIKESCTELVPSYLRFVKGIVDCEDLPLNISRETYQDSTLIGKLKNVVTRRVLKFIEDEMKRDSVGYDRWYNEFYVFLKEGVMSDFENQEQLLRLMRYHSTMTDFSKTVSLEDYVK